MKFNQLSVAANKSRNRVGRGISAGQGKTAGMGTKGQKARTGHGKKEGFEGGQTPFMMRTPKLRGFRSHHPKAELVYTAQLNDLKGKVDNMTLAEAGITSSPYVKVKLVNKGELKVKVDVTLQGASASCVEAIQKLGGTFTKIAILKRAVTSLSEKKQPKS
jgi:large subunit ribosomal protein L15